MLAYIPYMDPMGLEMPQKKTSSNDLPSRKWARTSRVNTRVPMVPFGSENRIPKSWLHQFTIVHQHVPCSLEIWMAILSALAFSDRPL